MTEVNTLKIENLEPRWESQGLSDREAEVAQGGYIWENADGSIEIFAFQQRVESPKDQLSGIHRG